MFCSHLSLRGSRMDSWSKKKKTKKGNAMQQLAKAYIIIGTSYRNIFSYSLKKFFFTDHNSIISCNALTGPTFTSETRK